ncbi:hypothetical protein [Ornithinimicrobium cerasi]|uniref:hypothetical protein n=1 Tax=Ornithinimicrobium cerasi TaxID=2248773 RepID=UPI000EFF2F81|nr:hypothetical protein [Ornithinimicrobium cerasi]
MILNEPIQASFVQPTPDGGVLIASARRRRDTAAATAQRWSADGSLVGEGNFGDAIEEVLVTDSGATWVGYFDEALTAQEPEGHGLVRFNSSLEPEWLYPWRSALPPLDDIMALNVFGETAYACPYREFHVIAATAAGATDLGPAPVTGAHALLVSGSRAVLIGGFGPDYDVVTPLEITPGGPVLAGRQGRVVMPDGLETRDVTWTCRGPEAHVCVNAARYRLSLDFVFDVLT